MANLLTKAVTDAFRQILGRTTGEARGTVGGFALGVNPLWGQPYPEQVAGDAAGLISRERMREIVLRTPTAAACMNAILDFAGGVKIDVRNVDPTKDLPKQQKKRIKALLERPNPDQTKRQFMLTLIRDLVTFGYAAIELADTNNPDHPTNMWVMDSARLRIDFDEHGKIRGYDMVDARGIPIIAKPQGKSIYEFPHGMDMGVNSLNVPPSYADTTVDANVAPGTELHGWEPDEVIFFSLNPISESVYPHSRIVQLFSSAVLEDMMMQFIAERFTDSNIPFGVFDLGDVTETELRLAIENWNSQGKTGNRILMTGSKGAGSKWMPFGYHLKDLEATQLLQEFRMKIMGILGVTMNEIGESQDAGKSNGYNLSFTFKKRAIGPVLDEITETLSKRLLWDKLGYIDAELYYEEIDSRDDFLMSQIDTNYQKIGILTPNEIRNRRGLTSIQGGDTNYAFTGNAWVPVDLLEKMAESAIAIEQASAGVSISEDGGRFRAQAQQTNGASGGPSANTPQQPNQSGGLGHSGTSTGHARGKSSETSRQLGQQ